MQKVARDLGQMVDRRLSVAGLGYEVFNVSNDGHSVDRTTAELVDEFYADVGAIREMGERETYYVNGKVKERLRAVSRNVPSPCWTPTGTVRSAPRKWPSRRRW